MSTPRRWDGGLRPADLLGAAPTLARNLLGLAAPGVLAPVPAHLTWVLTDRCPMRCGHCDLGRPGAELDHAQRMRIAHDLAASGVWGVSLIGGEPMVVEGVLDYAEVLRRGGVRVILSTSGYRLDGERLARVIDLGIDYVVMSLEGLDAATHDGFRGRRGLFDTLCHAADEIRARRRDRRPEVQVRFTIHRRNVDLVERFVETWSERVDNVQLQVIQDNGLHRVRDRSLLFTPEDRPALERAVAQWQARWPAFRGKYFDHLAGYVFEPEALHRSLGFRCLLVPQVSASLHPDGTLRLCGGRGDTAVGSILTEDLTTLWTRASTARERARMQSADFGCMCWESRCASNLDLIPAQRVIDRLRGGRAT